MKKLRLPPILEDTNSYEFKTWLSDLWRSEVESAGSVTLTANSATTVVSDAKVSQQSRIFFFPTTANGAAEIGAGGMYVSSKGDKTFTITHANNAQNDRTFDYVVE